MNPKLNGADVLLSMTGQGQGRRQFGPAEVSAEVRAVNNRHLKVHMRTSDALGTLEPRIEALVRTALRRGSLQLNVQLSGGEFESRYQLQEAVIAGYLEQCQKLTGKMGLDAGVTLRDLLPLPGVVAENRSLGGTEQLPPGLVEAVLEAVTEALTCLNGMRKTEGQSMADELQRQLSCLVALTEEIEQRAPAVVEAYRVRLSGQLSKALAEVGGQLQEADLVREVLIMADKADIREELVRLKSHFAQFRSLLAAEESQGRKLDFLIQELFRESNTIGAKAGDAHIAQRVVDIKTIIEQMRELVQNVE
ncbi:MAG: YicC family protein [Planctomycetales bacterium]|nr:YicC family protein [Planctomycetales bacterium]